MQVRCVDAAREATRLAGARGRALGGRRRSPHRAERGARVQVHRDGEFLVATVVAHSNLLPSVGYCRSGGRRRRSLGMIAARPRWSRSRWSRCCYSSPARGAYVGSAVVARHRAQAAADLAALAAAARIPSGGTAACARATAVAREMRVDGVQCQVDGLDVVVTAEVAVVFAGRTGGRAGGASGVDSLEGELRSARVVAVGSAPADPRRRFPRRWATAATPARRRYPVRAPPG